MKVFQAIADIFRECESTSIPPMIEDEFAAPSRGDIVELI